MIWFTFGTGIPKEDAFSRTLTSRFVLKKRSLLSRTGERYHFSIRFLITELLFFRSIASAPCDNTVSILN